MARKSAPHSNLRSQWFGKTMRELRKNRKISLSEAAGFIQRDPGMLSRYELGEYPFRRSDAIALMTFYGVSDQRVRSNVLEQCDELWRKGWWDPHADDLGREFINIPWLESQAVEICSYENMIIDGLLQTPEYAQSVIEYLAPSGVDEDQVSRWINLRVERQQVLDAKSGTRLTHIIEESVLHRQVGEPETLKDQIEFLIEANSRPNIEIRVVPSSTGLHFGVEGTFKLYRLPEQYEDVAVVPSQGGFLYVEEPNCGRLYARWNQLLADTLDSKSTEQLLKGVLKGLS